ncbi:uncharacterized protein B0H18DRAFT_51229 [Fomitopsis serialis]|uniref:uncharacterized protein n=1 Tax=Fomitopsis serialis TaxID=139415 RepID=UPI002007905E|nr:uncharacterized protein B0H18DRAFT_51229 [Neoantrodia serialis]KAH9932233.1 hypothetical protein B0H18DRAFT_51229 [Neoantrodia serialis]
MSAVPPTLHFPAPIGGVPSHDDFPPSLLFEILYVMLIPLIVFRFASRASRTMAIINIVATTTERVVSFALRMAEANNPALRMTKLFVDWLQGAYIATFISIGNDIVHIGRAYLVSTTLGAEPEMLAMTSRLPTIMCRPGGSSAVETKAPSKQEEVDIASISILPDEPGRRRRIRVVCTAIAIILVVGGLTAPVESAMYYTSMTDPSKVKPTQLVRVIGTILGLIGLQSMNIFMLHAWMTRPRRVQFQRILYLCCICCILTITAVYRLAVMPSTTTSLLPSAPDPLNGPIAKALFYVFHIVPEWLAAVLVLCINVRVVYNTGFGGDLRVKDKM